MKLPMLNTTVLAFNRKVIARIGRCLTAILLLCLPAPMVCQVCISSVLFEKSMEEEESTKQHEEECLAASRNAQRNRTRVQSRLEFAGDKTYSLFCSTFFGPRSKGWSSCAGAIPLRC